MQSFRQVPRSPSQASAACFRYTACTWSMAPPQVQGGHDSCQNRSTFLAYNKLAPRQQILLRFQQQRPGVNRACPILQQTLWHTYSCSWGTTAHSACWSTCGTLRSAATCGRICRQGQTKKKHTVRSTWGSKKHWLGRRLALWCLTVRWHAQLWLCMCTSSMEPQ